MNSICRTLFTSFVFALSLCYIALTVIVHVRKDGNKQPKHLSKSFASKHQQHHEIDTSLCF